MIAIDDVREAAARLDGIVHRTPVLTSATLDERTGATVLLKAENFQRIGAFKLRGAYNRISRLTDDEKHAGVFAFSSGNHAQAVALSAQLVGTTATILMPTDTPPSKLDATRGYGAEIVPYDRYAEDREAIGAALSAERGLVNVPPFDDPFIMAGQGTVALELLEDVGMLDVLVAPMGGGGLMAGCSTVARALLPDVRIVGVEPETGDDHRRSMAAGERVRLPSVPRTIADGLQVDMPGALTFAVNQRTVDEVVTVSDDAMVRAMAVLFERLKIVVEPSGAVGVAALLEGTIAAASQRVGVVLSGGNISAGNFAALVTRGETP